MYKNLIIKLVCLTASLVLCACSLIPDFSDEDSNQKSKMVVSSNSDEQSLVSDEMKIHLQEWRNMKPSIQRLVAIESELKELVVQLGGMVQQQNLTAPLDRQADSTSNKIKGVAPTIVNDTVVTSPVKPIITPIDRTANLSANSVGMIKKHGVQLGSMTDKNALKTTWIALMKKHSKVLSKLTPLYEEVLLNGTVFYRLKAGGLASQAEGTLICKKLNGANSPCFTSLYNGIPFL